MDDWMMKLKSAVDTTMSSSTPIDPEAFVTAFENLDDRSKRILRMRYKDDLKLAEIAWHEDKISYQRVEQIIKSALIKMSWFIEKGEQ